MALLAAIGDDVSRRRRRRLFLAKKADKQLGSYAQTGWVELRSLPRRKPWRYYEKRPTSFGGPVIICLDTSWSMAGPRENLAKAVVLEASVMAARDGRSCYVLAFSGERNVAEYDGSVSVGVRNKAALVALLDFLACGFRGGTDVTGPLTRAIELMEDRGNVEWGAADLLLVTDGELQTPPVRPDLMDKLGRMEVEAGLEIHGLLVGRNHSVPLQMLCTDWDGEDRVHNFLFKYDPINILRQQQQQQREENSFYSAPATVLSGGGGGRSVSSSRRYYHGHGRRPGAHDRWRRGHTRLAMCAGGAGTSAVDDMYRVARQQAADKVNSARGRHDASPEPAAASDDVRGVIRAARAALEAGLIERETEVQILLLAVLCREHVLLLGPPGTGKSELGRRLASISGGDAVFFERLLTKYTLPEELFGALSLSALEQDLYVRNTAGYLPTASVAFLDEVFKASSSILNSLLTILNERRFDNGNQRLKVPLLAVVAASNELPDSEELDALYDRFLFRREVKPVSDGALADLLALPAAASAPAQAQAPTVAAPALLTEELTAAIEQQAAQVTLSADAMHLLRDVRAFLRDEADPPVYISDRRLVKAAHMLRIAAATQGRAQVSTLHCLLLQHVLWHSLEDQQRLRDFLWKHAVPDAGVSGLEFIIGSLQQRIVVSCEQHEQPPSPPLTDTSQLQGVLDELTTYSTILAAKAADLSQLAADAAAAPTTQLWLSTADRAAVRQQLAPRAEAQAAAVTALLEAVEALRAAATDTARPWGDRATVLEQVWETYHAGTGRAVRYESGEFYDDGSSDDLIFDFTMSKKEAAKKLSPEQLKLWKKGAKALQSKKKKSSSEEDAFDDDE
jgi:MoxR-like ATPase